MRPASLHIISFICLLLSAVPPAYTRGAAPRLYPAETHSPDMRSEGKESIFDLKLSWINSAEKYIDIEVWNMWKYDRGPVRELYDALEEACRRGVKVRIAVGALDDEDEHISSGFFECPDIEVINTRIPAHSKYMIVDEKKVTAGSANWSWSAMVQNYEYNLCAECPDTSLAFTYFFESLWEAEGGEVRNSGSYPDNPAVIPLAQGSYTPEEFTSVYEYQLREIENAREKIFVSIYRYLPFFSDIRERIHSGLRDAARRGVKVKLLIDESTYDRSSQELIDALAGEKNIYVKINDLSAAPPIDGSGINHTKIFLVDGTGGAVTSMNWDRFVFDDSGRDCGIAFEDEELYRLIENSFLKTWRSPYASWASGQSPVMESVVKKPLIENLRVENLSPYSAEFRAEFSESGKSGETSVYFLWQRTPEGNRWEYQFPVIEKTASGSISYLAEGLIPGAEYALTLQAVNRDFRVRAPVIYFRTPAHQ